MDKATDVHGRLLLTKALLLNSEYERAAIEAQKLKEQLDTAGLDEVELGDMRSQVGLLARKIQLELSTKGRVGNINDAAYLGSSSKPKPAEETKVPVKQNIDKKFDWYQNASHIFISFKVSSASVASAARVTFSENTVSIEAPDVEPINLQLTNLIVPGESTFVATAKKLELKLKKQQENFNWMGVEKGGEAKLLATAAPLKEPVLPSYPTSSKKKKDWSEIDKDIIKQEANEKPEGDAALNALFKQIYERSDENTRRAMIKSYQTSGGTVLSTNWDEVASKDYEGKDRVDPPEGQEWAKKN